MKRNLCNCPNCQTSDCPAAFPPVRSEPLFSISRFRSVLVKHGIVLPEAIEDADGFDGERTLAATRAAYDELMENNAVRGAAEPRTPDGLVRPSGVSE